MVFESIVVDILNRLLGDYFENLDTSQLKLGIWGGDVVLRELLLKASAMDDLGLPFKVVVGKVGTLRMKIPWQSLYTAPVELNLQNLLLLVTPSYSVKYNEEAEEKALQAAKEKELTRLDEIRAREREKQQQEGQTPAQEDSFTEKLITQIIKNVQIRIDCIHIRYEDDVTKPASPFGFGIILKNLHIETTDTDWRPVVITEIVETVNKMATLEGLAVYWNSQTQLLQRMGQKVQMMEALRDIVLQDTPDLTYILGPISSTAKVLLTPNPERCVEIFSKPKFFVDLIMDELGLGMTNLQFQDIMELIESIDFMTRAQYYRKYRPAINIHRGHFKEWWMFAYKCIVEEEVRRKRQNWDWLHIKRHRNLCRIYADAYYKKLTSRKLKSDTTQSLQACEKVLDVFNLTLVRKQVEVKVEREGKKRAEEESKRQSGGWFGGWTTWLGGDSAPKANENTMGDIVQKFEEALTPEEKSKLYAAIDYSENALPLDYPDAYLEYQLKFLLSKLTLTVRDVLGRVTRGHKILKLTVDSVATKIATRPVKNGMQVEVLMASFEAEGLKGKHDTVPVKMITSKTKSTTNLLEVYFENNPLNSQAKQKIRIQAQPIEIVYHGKTIVHLVRCFALPPEMQLSKLQAAAVSTLNEWKEQSAAGLQHLAETRGEIDLQLDLIAPYILIPRGGVLNPNSSCLLIDLGELKIQSKPRIKKSVSVDKAMAKSHQHDVDYMEAMKKVAYDTLLIELRDFQVVLALPGENIDVSKGKLGVGPSVAMPQILIKSSQLILQLDQSLVPDDPRFAKLQLEGSLPMLNLNLSDRRLTELVKLLVTLPFPKADVPDSTTSPPVLSTISEDPTVSQSYAISKITYDTTKRKDADHPQLVEFIELLLKFTLDSIRIQISRTNNTSKNVPFVDFELKHIQAKLTNKTFSSAVDVAVGGLTLCALQNKTVDSDGLLYLLKTPMSEGIEKHLFKMHMFSIMPDCPIAFVGKVKQLIKVEVSSLDVILHSEALQAFIAFGAEIQKAVEEAAAESKGGSGQNNLDNLSVSSVSSVDSGVITKIRSRRVSKQFQKLESTRKAVAKKHINSGDVLLQIDAKMESLTVQISTEKKNLIKAILSELDLSMVQKSEHTIMLLELKDLRVRNLDRTSIYRDMMRVDSDKVVAIKVVMHEDATKGKQFYNMDKHDMSVKVETGSPKIFYVSRQLDELLAFIDNFSAAKDAVIDVSSAAASAAKENVEQAYSAATRILLDIELNAPIVFIPRNERSDHAILANLGRLSIKNKFVKQEVKHLSATAILDKMDITLTNMKLSRIFFNKGTQDAQSEVSMLDPVTLVLSINRNLSTDWYHGVADISLKGTLQNAFLRASNEDYDLMMSILFENILYVQEPSPATGTAATAPSSKSPGTPKPTGGSVRRRKTSVTLSKEHISETSVQTVLSARTIDNAVYTKLEVSIDIPQMRVIMYQKGAIQLETSQGVVGRDDATAFADFAIRSIKMDMKSFNNENISCPITVGEISLKDVRPGDRAVTNLIMKKADPDDIDSDSCVAKFCFKTDKANKKGSTMTLETTSLTIILCLDYLLQIVDFFSRSEAAIEYPKPDLTTKVEKFGTTSDPVPVREVTPDLPKVTIGVDEELEAEPFCAFYNFSETEIILVESMESVQSNALLLHCEVALKQQELNGRSNMMGTIGNLNLSTCNYDVDDNHQAIAEVISPMSITVVMNYSEAVGTLIDVNISDIFIRMTAGTLELLLKIVSTIGSSADAASAKTDGKDYSDLWDIKKNDEMNFWFLNSDASVEVGLEALQVQEDKVRLFNVAEELKVSERLVMESGCIVFTFETGVGNNTMPMLLIETDIDLQMFDWSTNMTVAGRCKLEAAYYNATFGLWEYLVEPVESRHHGRIAHQPWELLFEYSSRINPNAITTDEEAATNSYVSIALESSSILELTVTRTALEVVDILKDDFQAATKKLVSEKAISTAAYSIVNDTGSDLKIFIKEKTRSPCFVLVRGGVDYEEVLLKHGTSVNLGLIESSDMTKHHSSVLREQEGKEERLLSIEIEDYDFKREIPVNRATKRYYSLKHKDRHGHFGLICDIWVKDCSKIVTLRGVVQIMNDLQIDVDVYYKEDNGRVAKFAGTATAGQKCNLSIPCTFTKTGDLFFAPKGFNISNEPFSWLQALQELHKVSQVVCKSKSQDTAHFFIKVIGEAKQALHESTNRKNLASQCCYIYLEPPLLLNNLLPIPIGYYSSNELIMADRGSSICVTNLNVDLEGSCSLKLKIPEYNKMSWICNVVLDVTTPEISQWTFISESDNKITSTIGIHRETDDNEITLHIYTPYWMINRTGLDLVYKGDDKQSHQTLHSKMLEEPVIFSFPGKAFFSKKAAFVKVSHPKLPGPGSDWSEKFSIDVAGSGGSVTCKSPVHQFQLGIEIQLSSWGLTKYVIFTPRFYLVNQCSFQVSVKEEDKPGHIVDVSPNACVPYWPESTLPHLIAVIEADGSKNETKPFKYDIVRHTLLQLRGKYGGIHVDIHYSEAKTVITFTEFIPGQAPVLLVNGTTECPLEITEEGLDDVFILLPRMCQMFTWKDPIGPRVLRWSAVAAEKKPQGTDKLFGDGCGTFLVEGRTYYWISFLDGLQRVLLFTADMELTTYLQAARENEVATAEYIIMLHGIGISLVDNEKLKELLYMRIASSEISWESSKPAKKKRFKPLAYDVSKSIEMAYQNYLNQKAIQASVKTNICLDSGFEVDFSTMMISKPHQKNIRRVFQTGIWLHYKTLPNSSQFHAKINRLQIDNQLPDTIFRVVFAPVPPPKSVSTTDVPKPFAEVSIMQRINAHSYVQQFKYFKILVQEFHIKLDISFVNALVDMFSGTSASRQESMLMKFNAEFSEACLNMKDVLARQIVSQGQKHFYDFLHFSPLKMHISFSMGGSAQLSNHFLNLVLASVGVTLTEIQDVVFKLSCMELQHSFLSGDQLYNEVYSHYTSQAIKQLYVLVLGLDVLGNPYGLAMGVASGVEAFFYEPLQGAIQGPGEFAEGLALGVKKLLGSTVGGAAGAFSKITGTLGKGIAALTMDDEYQKKRRENMHHRGDAAEGLARSGKGLVMGFVEGLTGFVSKPIRGAKEDGVGGFFKGVGKGTIGLVARPAAGVVDFASGSFDAVKKCASTNVEVHRMRPPRCIPPDSVLQPYVKHEAEGVQLLVDIEKGRYSRTDSYIAHALINPHGIYVVLLTNKRLMYLKRDEMFGGWGVEWTYIWEDFSHPPDLVERGLLFTLKTAPRKKLKVFGSAGSREIIIPIYSAEVCTWLLSKIEEAMKTETGMVFTDGIEATELSFA